MALFSDQGVSIAFLQYHAVFVKVRHDNAIARYINPTRAVRIFQQIKRGNVAVLNNFGSLAILVGRPRSGFPPEFETEFCPLARFAFRLRSM